MVAALRNGAERYAQQVGRPLELRRVLVRDASKARDGIDAAVLLLTPRLPLRARVAGLAAAALAVAQLAVAKELAEAAGVTVDQL